MRTCLLSQMTIEQAICMVVRREQTRAWQQKNRLRQRGYERLWRKLNPDKRRNFPSRRRSG